MKEITLLFLLLASSAGSMISQNATGDHEHRESCSKVHFIQLMNEEDKNNALLHYDITHYFLDIEVSPMNTYIKGMAQITATSRVSNLQEIVLELTDEMLVSAVKVNNRNASYIHGNDELVIASPDTITPKELFTVTVHYEGNSQGGGVTTAYNPTYSTNVTWTLSESFHAKEWWPTKEVLSDKADSATILLTTNKNYEAVSNGLLIRKENLGSEKVKYHWKTKYPINYYLVSFAVADYLEYSFYAPVNETDSVLVQNFIYSTSYLNENKDKIDTTSGLVKLYSELFGSYPFAKEKYGHALTELGGGMEHQTITTIGNFRYLLVAHELAHQWFGDWVTCGSWQDIWINEGFASYSEYLALEFAGKAREASEWMETAHAYAFQEPYGSVYIPFADANSERRIFNYALSYKKGAAIIHTLRYLVDNDSLFFATLKQFLNTYKNSFATGDDFLQLINEATGKDYTGFFDDWYYGKGYPEYTLKWGKDENGTILSLTQNHSAGEGRVYETPVEVRLISAKRDTTVKLYPDSRVIQDTIKFDVPVESVILDPSNWILNKVNIASNINELSQKNIQVKVYPNPVKNFAVVDFKTPTREQRRLNVYKMDGTLVYSVRSAADKVRINTNFWSQGIYVLEIVENKSHLCIKIVK